MPKIVYMLCHKEVFVFFFRLIFFFFLFNLFVGFFTLQFQVPFSADRWATAKSTSQLQTSWTSPAG